MNLLNKLKFWKKKEVKEEKPLEVLKPEIKKELKTVILDNRQFGRMMSYLNKIYSETAKEKTLISHDKRIQNFIDETNKILDLIKEVKAKPEIDQRLIQKMEAKIVLARKGAMEIEILDTIKKMILANEIPHVRNLEKYVVKSEQNPKGFISRATMFKILDKLIRKEKLVKTGTGKYVLYRPFDMLSEEEKEYLTRQKEMIRKEKIS